jgi:hypothetical protein
MKVMSQVRKFLELRKLESWFNLQATKVVEDQNHGRDIRLDQVNVALFSREIIKEPITYEEVANKGRLN